MRENLELGSYATRDYNWDQVTEYFPKLQLLMDRKAGHLSGGERQMLMIGRAILGAPKLVLIDEPTEGLAPASSCSCATMFKELAKKTALVIVEQNLPLVCAIADKIYALKEGRIMAELTERDQITPEACDLFDGFNKGVRDEFFEMVVGLLLAFALLAVMRVFLPLPFSNEILIFSIYTMGCNYLRPHRFHFVRPAGLSGRGRLRRCILPVLSRQ